MIDADELLVGGVGVAVQEADGDRLDALVAQLGDQPGHRLGIRRLVRRSVGVRALVDFEPQVARHERRGQLQKQVVELVAMLARDLVGIAEAARREQCGAGAFALDDGVGDQRGAVDDAVHVGGLGLAALERLAQHLGDGHRRIGRRGQDLADGEVAGRVVDQDQVGEGAADVDADPVATWHVASAYPSGLRSSLRICG